MKIAAFISHPIQYFSPLWQELSRRPGVHVKVFYYSRQGLDLSFDEGFGRALAWDVDLLGGYEHQFLPRQWPTTDPLDHSMRGLNSKLVRTLRQDWDIVFVSGYYHINNWVIIAACRLLRIPTIYLGDSSDNLEREKPVSRRLIKHAALTPFISNITAFLAPGGQQRNYLIRYGAEPDSIFDCPFVVDIGAFQTILAQAGSIGLAALRKRHSIADGQRVIAFGGKLVRGKRPLDLVEALKKLGRHDVVGLFIGDGPMREDITRLGGDLVRVTGFVNRSEIPLYIKLADVLVLPSQSDAYGIIVSEAQALGIPCVVSDRCGCYGPHSVLQDGQSGLVYSCGDTAQLSTCLATLLGNHDVYSQMALAATVQGELQSQVHAANGFLAAAEYALRKKMRAPTAEQ